MAASLEGDSSMQYRGDMDIAIVGMACMFPKSPDLRRYWENIIRRLDCIQEIPEERWHIPQFFDEDRFARDKVYSKWGGFLESARFDPMKWKIPPASLLSIDPIQLLSLEVANQAFEDAGYHKRTFPKERTGVIFACAGSHDVGFDYAFRTMLQHYLPRVKDLTQEAQQHIVNEINSTLPEWTEDSFPGFLMNVIAGRIANRFDLGGPNYVVDAACAASLAALHAAIGQLRLKTVDAMLVGAADGTNNPFCYMSFAKTHALSPRGRSRPFDNSADGIALGEGIGAIMIRRLEDAERDGDQIYAVIKGIGASSDGRNRSMTAPHPPGQIMAMERAYADADVPAATVTLVEAHGTGTAVGDSTEITSLHTLFSEATSDEQYAAVGSVKSMIGHTKTCAGLASLIKTSLALKHKVLPPTINVDTPNEKVDFRHSPFFINTETRPWFEELGEHPRRAGVSAFGFGGTNFHVVMEEYVRPGQSQFSLDMTPRSAELCFWQRGSRDEMVTAIKELQQKLQGLPTSDLAQLAASIRLDEQAETQKGCRLAVVVSSVDDLRAKLDKALTLLARSGSFQDPSGIYCSEAAVTSADKVAFLYPGQGSQQVNMLRDLAVVSQWAQEFFTAANRSLKPYFPVAITRMIFPPPAFSKEEETERNERLKNTAVAQPALGVVEAFATDLLKKFGVVPQGVAGHSYGEYVALYTAGSLTLDELLSLSAERGQVSAAASEVCPGSMAAVQAGADQTRAAIEKHSLKVSLANLNGPMQTIIAGATDAVEEAISKLTSEKIRCTLLPVTAAFHTPLLASATKPLSEALKKAKVKAPSIKAYSNTLAAQYPDKPAEIRKLLQRHLVEPVRFEEQMRQMRADGFEIFIEVGPGRVLSGLMGRIFPEAGPTLLTLDGAGRDGVVQLAHVLAQLSTLGLPIDLKAWFDGRGLNEVSVTDFVADVIQKKDPKKGDWILSVAGAKPVTPLPPRKGLPGEGLRAKFSGKSGTTPTTPTPSVQTPVVKLNGTAAMSDTSVDVVSSSPPLESPVRHSVPAVSASAGISTPGVNRLQRHGTPALAPAPLPTVTRRTPLPANGTPINYVNGPRFAEHLPSSATAVTEPPAVTKPYTNGSVAHGDSSTETVHKNGSTPCVSHAELKNPTTGTTGPAPVAPTPTIPSSVVIPGSTVPMAPCMPLVTPWNGSLPMVASAQPLTISTNGSYQPARNAVSTSHPSENGQTLNPAATQLILQSQAVMMQMLDLQKWQQQVALKFMDAHQQLINGCANGTVDFSAAANLLPTGLPTPALAPLSQQAVAQPSVAPQAVAPVPAPAVAAAPAAPAPAAPVSVPVTPVAISPVTMAPKPVAMAAPTPVRAPAPAPAIAKVVATVKTVAVTSPAPVVMAAAPAVSAPAAPAVDGVPTPEAFKADLLQAVSERTGYPEDMLDLDLPMESGLGIDSIKTVEIFSNLKTYHSYFQQDEQDEEEALKEFTKLKTLGDIVSAYELRYQAVTSAGNSPRIAQKAGEGVERYTLTAAEAPTNSSQKKTSHVNS